MNHCKQCGKTVKSKLTINPSWVDFSLCPYCLNTRANKGLKFNHAEVLIRNVNPVDVFWNYMTEKELERTREGLF